MDEANYIEIDTKTIKENIKKIVSARKGYKYYIGVIKGKAYGHGYEVAKYLVDSEINYLAVATFNEALEVRKYVDKKFPILCLQPVDLKNIGECLKNNLTITVFDFDYYKKLIKLDLKKRLKIHVKLNTGLNRIGIDDKEELNKIYKDLIIDKKYNIELEGIYSHFATLGIVDPEWDKQVNRFKNLLTDIDISKVKMIHLYTSNSMSVHPKLDICNAVRIGQLMFGNNYYNIPSDGFINKLKCIKRNFIRNKNHLSELNENFYIDVKPAFKLVSKVESIKSVKKGERVGYDGEFLANDNIKVAMAPIGYSDGLYKNFTNKHVMINNKKYQIIGEICMGMTLIKVDDNVKLNDEIIFIGDELTPKKVARSVGLSPLQLLCEFDSSIKRIYK